MLICKFYEKLLTNFKLRFALTIIRIKFKNILFADIFNLSHKLINE